jgi:5-methylcytosine-specific restriction endonuclease McrA
MKEDYRNQALKILPWVCAKCGREFSGKKLQELTVHHKDHNYKNNPPDGSNWEMLCTYCHDNEHSRGLESQWQNGTESQADNNPAATHSPFANLNKLLSRTDRDK